MIGIIAKVRIQPVRLEPTEIGLGKAQMAEEAWAHGPPKPRDVTRAKEIPPEPVDLSSLTQKYDFIEVLPARSVSTIGDVDALPRDVSAFVVTGLNFGLLGHVCQIGKPILTPWDAFGYSWSGRLIREFVDEEAVPCFVPFGADDVKTIIRVLRAATFLRNLRALYIGDIPSHSVRNASYDFDDMQRRLGIQFKQIGIDEFEETVGGIGDEDARIVAEKWLDSAKVLDARKQKIVQYAKNYLGLKKLLEGNRANAVTMDCAFLKSVELVPCFSFANMIDEGIPTGCEGDTSALISMSILMGVSGHAALMGNLFSNTTHQDIEENVIVVNHDVVPPSMAKEGQRVKLRDFHGTKKGLTGFVELETGAAVTLLGMDTGARRLWCSRGQIVWTEDTTHCRTSIGIKVKDAKRVGRESFGHHQALTYGDWHKELEMLSRVLGVEMRCLDT